MKRLPASGSVIVTGPASRSKIPDEFAMPLVEARPRPCIALITAVTIAQESK